MVYNARDIGLIEHYNVLEIITYEGGAEMLFDQETIRLEEGKELIMRSPAPGDEESMLDFLKTLSAETIYMIRYPEEVAETVSEEREILEKFSSDPKKGMIGLFDENRCIGNIGIHPIGTQIKLSHRASIGLGIRKEFWGRGLGKKLLEEGLKTAGKMGYERVELGVYESNVRAIHLYESAGFEACGKTPKAFRLKDGTYEDEILMTKAL